MKKMLTELSAVLRAIAPEKLGEPITETDSLVGDLKLDKIQLMLFALSVEDNFDIRFTGSPEINTVGDVINYIEAYLYKHSKNFGKGLVMGYENGTYT